MEEYLHRQPLQACGRGGELPGCEVDGAGRQATQRETSHRGLSSPVSRRGRCMPPTRRCGRRPKPNINPNCSCGCSRGLDHDHHCVVAIVSVAIVIEIAVVVMVVVHGHTCGCDNCILSWTMSNARINLSTTCDKCQVRTITSGIQRLRILNGPMG